MRYVGSKRKIAKHIVPIINALRKPSQLYIEPFVGGANMIEHIENPRIGYDINPYLIACLRQIRDDPTVFPKNNLELTEAAFVRLRKTYKSAPRSKYPLIGFAGFAASFGGVWFNTWSRGKTDKGASRDYIKEAYRNVCTQSKKLQGAQFEILPYDKITLDECAVLYCDPPYQSTIQYTTDFDHDHFFQWCRDRARDGHTVLVSEYNAPDDFHCLWSYKQHSTVSSANTPENNARTERLFLVK